MLTKPKCEECGCDISDPDEEYCEACQEAMIEDEGEDEE